MPTSSSSNSFADLVRGSDLEVLKRLLHPMTPEEFVASYGKKVIFIKGHKDKFAGLFETESLPQIFRASMMDPSSLRASFPHDPLAYMRCTPEQTRMLFDAGATICVTAFHRHEPRLARLSASIKAALHSTGEMGFNTYWSPDGSGFRTHFDARTSMTLQVEGSKTWRFSRTPAIIAPLGNAMYDWKNKTVVYNTPPSTWESVEVPDPSQFDEVTIEPGDILSVPGGYWHDASAVGYSLSLNLFFQNENFLEALYLNMRDEFLEMEEIRQALPMAIHSAPDKLPDAVRDRLSVILQRFKDRVNALDVDSREMRDLWRLAISTTALVEPLSDEIMKFEGELHPSQRLRVKRGVPCLRTLEEEEGKPRLLLFYGGDHVSLPAQLGPLVDTLLTKDTFVASEATMWGNGFSWEKLRPVLEEFLRLELLRVVR